VRGYIERALAWEKTGRYLPADVLEILLRGDAKLWVSWDGETVEAAIVTQVIDYPRLRELRVWLVGGRNMKAWVHEAQDILERFAKEYRCAVVSSGGRKGWLRASSGYRETGVSFEKVL
jgi:hypothetical protein